MQAIKSLFRRHAKQTAKAIVPAPANGRGPTPLTPDEQRAVAGGLPRGGWQVPTAALLE